METNPKDIHLQVSVLGGPSVGKTSLIRALTGKNSHLMEQFDRITQQTFFFKFLEFQQFQSIQEQILVQQNSIAYILVYDVQDKKTLDHIRDSILDKVTDQENSFLLLIGNKSDIECSQQITKEAEQLATLNGMFFLEISAKKERNVELIKKVLRIRSSHNLRKMSEDEKERYLLVDTMAKEQSDKKKQFNMQEEGTGYECQEKPKEISLKLNLGLQKPKSKPRPPPLHPNFQVTKSQQVYKHREVDLSGISKTHQKRAQQYSKQRNVQLDKDIKTLEESLNQLSERYSHKKRQNLIRSIHKPPKQRRSGSVAPRISHAMNEQNSSSNFIPIQSVDLSDIPRLSSMDQDTSLLKLQPNSKPILFVFMTGKSGERLKIAVFEDDTGLTVTKRYFQRIGRKLPRKEVLQQVIWLIQEKVNECILKIEQFIVQEERVILNNQQKQRYRRVQAQQQQFYHEDKENYQPNIQQREEQTTFITNNHHTRRASYQAPVIKRNLNDTYEEMDLQRHSVYTDQNFTYGDNSRDYSMSKQSMPVVKKKVNFRLILQVNRKQLKIVIRQNDDIKRKILQFSVRHKLKQRQEKKLRKLIKLASKNPRTYSNRICNL